MNAIGSKTHPTIRAPGSKKNKPQHCCYERNKADHFTVSSFRHLCLAHILYEGKAAVSRPPEVWSCFFELHLGDFSSPPRARFRSFRNPRLSARSSRLSSASPRLSSLSPRFSASNSSTSFTPARFSPSSNNTPILRSVVRSLSLYRRVPPSVLSGVSRPLRSYCLMFCCPVPRAPPPPRSRRPRVRPGHQPSEVPSARSSHAAVVLFSGSLTIRSCHQRPPKIFRRTTCIHSLTGAIKNLYQPIQIKRLVRTTESASRSKE